MGQESAFSHVVQEALNRKMFALKDSSNQEPSSPGWGIIGLRSPWGNQKHQQTDRGVLLTSYQPGSLCRTLLVKVTSGKQDSPYAEQENTLKEFKEKRGHVR